MRINKSLITYIPSSGAGSGSVTSVALTAPTGFSVSGSPITSSGTLALSFASGYSLPTTAKQLQWDQAFSFSSSFPVGTTGQLVRFLSTGSLEAFTPNYMPNPLSALGQMIYSNSAGAPLVVAPNTTTTRKYLSMLGDGTDGAPPTWETISGFIGGSGTTNYIPKFTASGTIGDSIIAENSGIATIYGVGQIYTQQANAGNSTLFISNYDTASFINHQTRISTQNLGSGVGRTIIQAASHTTNTNRGQFGITNEEGSSFIMQLGQQVTSTDYSMSIYTTSGIEQIRLNTNGNTYFTGGNVGIGISTLTSSANYTSLSISGTNGSEIYMYAGSTLYGYLYADANGMTLSPQNSVPLTFRTSSIERLRIQTTGQLKLNAYTSVSSFSGTIAGLLAFDSSGNVIARNNVVDLSLTTSGSSGSATYNTVTGALNIPTYTLAGLGGMANVFTSLGDLVYSNAAGAPLRLAGNTTTTKKFLSQTGDGVSSDAPFWTTLSVSDVSGAVGLTAFSASSPLAYNSGTGAFSIQVANVSQNGYLSSTDWVTFNGKQTQITLTTTGSSGASTFNALTGALNIPEYTLAGLGGLSNPMTSLGDMIYGNSAGAPQRLAPNTTTTRKYLSMLGDGTFGAIPTWETINSLTGTGTSGYITYWNGTSSVTASANFVYDATNTRFGLGISTPSVMSHFRAANGATIMRLENSDTIVSLGETIGKIEFYGNDVGAGSGVTAYIDCRATSINGDNAIDIFSGSNGNVIGGVSVLPSGAVNFTPISTPATAAAGDVYYDSSTNKLRCYNGTSWNDLF